MSSNRERLRENRLRVTIEFEGHIVGEYEGFDGEHYYIVEVYGRVPNDDRRDSSIFDMMFFQYMIGRVTRTASTENDHVAIMVDTIPASEYSYTNIKFYGGILPTPENLQEYEDRDRGINNG